MGSTAKRTLIGFVTAAALVAMAAGSSLAQRPGGNTDRPGGNTDRPGGQTTQNRQGGFGGYGSFGFGASPMVKAAADGVYVLNNGTLTKYGTDLKEKGSVKLVEPPAPPASTDATARQMPARMAPGALLVNGDSAIVVIGDQLFNVNSAMVASKVSLPSMQAPPAAGGNSDAGQGNRTQFAAIGPAPVLEVQGSTVYVVRGLEIVAVDLAQNKVLGIVSLPQPAAPSRPSNN